MSNHTICVVQVYWAGTNGKICNWTVSELFSEANYSSIHIGWYIWHSTIRSFQPCMDVHWEEYARAHGESRESKLQTLLATQSLSFYFSTWPVWPFHLPVTLVCYKKAWVTILRTRYLRTMCIHISFSDKRKISSWDVCRQHGWNSYPSQYIFQVKFFELMLFLICLEKYQFSLLLFFIESIVYTWLVNKLG